MTPEVKAALLALEVNGLLSAQDVLNHARDESNPLHRFFDWDDSTAAEKHRLGQARSLIQSYEIEFIGADQIAKVVRGYVSVQVPQVGRTYARVEAVLSDAVLREQVLDALRGELSALRRRYGHLQEYSNLLQQQADEAAERLVS